MSLSHRDIHHCIWPCNSARIIFLNCCATFTVSTTGENYFNLFVRITIISTLSTTLCTMKVYFLHKHYDIVIMFVVVLMDWSWYGAFFLLKSPGFSFLFWAAILICHVCVCHEKMPPINIIIFIWLDIFALRKDFVRHLYFDIHN